MNLREFIDYKSHCPLCNEQLTLLFHSNKKQCHVIEDNGFSFLFNIKSFPQNKGKTFHVAYSFNYDSDVFYIQFYNKDLYLKDYIPLSLINRFKEYDHNNTPYKLIKKCQSCENYYYCSNEFELNDIIDFSVFSEEFTISKNNKIYRIHNNYFNNKTILCIGASHKERPNSLIFDLIQFTTPAETFDRIEKLIIFS